MNKLRVFYYIGVVCLLWTAISMERANTKVVVQKLSEPVGTLDLDNLSNHPLRATKDAPGMIDPDFKSTITEDDGN
jgi:hypothetical protein